MIVFIGDLHGNPDALSQLASGLALIDSRLKWSASDTSLVITGDVCDRGTDSASIYRTIMNWQDSAPSFGSEVIFLMGNHEVMNVSGYYYYNTPAETASYSGDGGSGEDAKRAAFAPGGWLFQWLLKQQFIMKIDPFIVAHADFPRKFRFKTIKEISAESRRLFLRAAEGRSEVDQLLWCREAFSDLPAYEASLSGFLEKNGAEHWVCGHTPALNGQIRQRYSGKYICVDTAMGLRPGCASALVFRDGKIKAAYPDWQGGMNFADPVDY